MDKIIIDDLLPINMVELPDGRLAIVESYNEDGTVTVIESNKRYKVDYE